MTISAEAGCNAIHSLLDQLPRHTQPSQVPFRDGLYFFYEQGETSAHAPSGRIVRVGNHPRSVGGLVRRLRNHYRSGTGAKNGSVFRKYLGGALLRRDDPDCVCLSPSPGAGHWEKQNAAVCESCAELEGRVGILLDDHFSFRCLAAQDIGERNALEVT